MSAAFLEIQRGDGPIVLGMPHTGTELPDAIADGLNDRGRALTDTDWRIETLFEGLRADATIVRTRIHRYAVDVNRPPDGASLYPGQATTGLVPTTDFDGRPIWLDGSEPDEAEIERRRDAYHAPYHAALGEEIARVRAAQGVAILFDCHSIRSIAPRLFDGELPALNVGTNGGVSCDPRVERIVVDTAAASGLSWVLNGRFRGGWTTRHWGRPHHGVHAIQMEIAQRAYLSAETAPWRYDSAVAAPLRSALRAMLDRLADASVPLKENDP